MASQTLLSLRPTTTLSLSLSRRFLSTTVSLPPFLRPASLSLLSHSPLLTLPVRANPVRCRVNRAGGSGYSPLNGGGSGFSDRPPTEIAPLFPGCDYEHWLIVMEKLEDGATKQQMIDYYIQTLAKVLDSEEEAKKKIYNVSCERYFGFGCEIDEETSNQLEAELLV